jgi:chromate reductase, NAD(P)H dehydrogenase (quinone)
MVRHVGVFVGSLRKESLNRRTAQALMELAPESVELKIVEIGQLPLYNEDDDVDTPPAAWTRRRKAVQAAGGVLFVTPEYDRSVPAALKNALDVGSRPDGHNMWDGKPGAVVSVSPGALGGFGANHHLRHSLVFLNVPAMPQPEAYISGAAELFEAEGRLTSDRTREFLRRFMAAFAEWIEANTPRENYDWLSGSSRKIPDANEQPAAVAGAPPAPSVLRGNEFRVSDVPPGSALLLGDVAVYHVAGRFCATQSRCPHRQAPLNKGKLDGSTVTCPVHGAQFNVCTGAVLRGPATEPLKTYGVIVDGEIGRVEIGVLI